MKLLALDTSSDACTVAVGSNAAVASRHALAAREHTRLLMPMIDDVMSESGLDFRDLDGIVLGNGPGSFIGMRIGAAVVQGIAFAASLPVIPVSSMAALALQTLEEQSEDHVAVAQDAHNREVYFGLYERSAGGLVTGAGSERLAGREPIAELLALPERSCIAAGLGWRVYPDLYTANEARIAGRSSHDVPDARFVLQLGKAALARGEQVAPADVDPIYLRQQVASAPTAKVP